MEAPPRRLHSLKDLCTRSIAVNIEYWSRNVEEQHLTNLYVITPFDNIPSLYCQEIIDHLIELKKLTLRYLFPLYLFTQKNSDPFSGRKFTKYKF